MNLPHPGQILTTKKTILSFINDIDMSVTDNTVYLLTYGLNSQEDYLRLYATCARLYYLSKLVYLGKDGVRKLEMERYIKELFEARAETPDEILHIMNLQKSESISAYSKQDAIKVFEKLQKLQPLWCHSISCVWEQIYIPELAYAFDYVLRHDDCPMPEFKSEWSLFPDNIENYNYTEDIAAYFDDVMITCF